MGKEKKYIHSMIAFVCIGYGITFPSWTNEWTLFIMENLQASIISQDSNLLLITTFHYIAKYLLTFFLIFFGTLLCSHTIFKHAESVIYSIFFIGITFTSLFIFNYMNEDHFSYQAHIFTIGIVVLLQLFIPKQKHYFFIVSIILLLVLTSSQWLQLIPALSGFGFGTNDIAVSIKIADNFFTENRLLNTMATIFFAVFLTIAISFTFLIYLVHKQIITLKKYQIQEDELKETKIALVESKMYEEINMLVHDLKTPLVTVEGLLSLIEMKMQPGNNSTLATYFSRTDQSIEKMKDMISEILYENIKQSISVTELIAYVTSHLQLDEQQIEIKINIPTNLPPIHVNKIRFSRAISNIIENAINSFSGKAGFIDIDVKRISNHISLQITDNGPGIKSTHLKNIWKDGFSTKKSSGIGLTFVKRVVENHQGTISVHSSEDSYTQMNILIPIIEERSTRSM